MNQISIYVTVKDWYYQFAFTKEEKEQVALPVDNRVLTMMEPEEVEKLVSISFYHLGTRCRVAQVPEYWKRGYT